MDKIKLNSLGLRNFRIFQNFEKIDFAPITLLIGPNNSGKSSVLKALQLFKKAAISDIVYGIQNFSESGLGKDISDVANVFSNDSTISLQYFFNDYIFDYETIGAGGAILNVKHESNSANLLVTQRTGEKLIATDQNKGKEVVFDLGIHYLSPTRYTVPRELYTFEFKESIFTSVLENFTKLNHPQNSIEYLEKWIKSFGIADSITVSKIGNYGGVLDLTKEGKKFHLSQMGYGTQQMLPILMQIVTNRGDVLLLEEPENSLHPNFQAKIADVLVDAYMQFGTHFIVETHSEYLLRKLQVLVKRGEIDAKNVVIYYFAEALQHNLEKRTAQISINQNGDILSPFGKGFIDEADNLTWELFRTEKQQS